MTQHYDSGWHGHLARAFVRTGETPVPPNVLAPFGRADTARLRSLEIVVSLEFFVRHGQADFFHTHVVAGVQHRHHGAVLGVAVA